jgi:hypothetical protein
MPSQVPYALRVVVDRVQFLLETTLFLKRTQATSAPGELCCRILDVGFGARYISLRTQLENRHGLTTMTDLQLIAHSPQTLHRSVHTAQSLQRRLHSLGVKKVQDVLELLEGEPFLRSAFCCLKQFQDLIANW